MLGSLNSPLGVERLDYLRSVDVRGSGDDDPSAFSLRELIHSVGEHAIHDGESRASHENDEDLDHQAVVPRVAAGHRGSKCQREGRHPQGLAGGGPEHIGLSRGR